MASDASAALAARQKVQNFLNAACTGNLDLLKSKIEVTACNFMAFDVSFSFSLKVLIFFKSKLGQQLDEGKGLVGTVADVKDANKRGALHFAPREGKTEVCKFLIEELQLEIDVKDDDGETPLIHATRQGHFATAKYLLDHGADPAASSELGATPLHHAARIGLPSFAIKIA
ncbi:hypothetical protein AAC387_Pa12g0629 [Persea americana]